MATASALVTLEQFLALPEEEPALEFINGVITQKVSPRMKHSAVQVDLATRFNEAGVPARRARAFTELRVTFAGTSTVPDLSVFEWSRIPEDEKGEVADEVFIPPDIAVEIVSPDQSTTVLKQKCAQFVVNGVRIALLVNPRKRTVLSYRPGETVTLAGSDRIDLDDVLPGFELTVQQLFAALRKDPLS